MEAGLGPVSHSLVQALRAVPSFASLDEPTLLALAGASANLYWAAGGVVFEPGAESEGLYVVVSGAARVLDGDTEIAVLGPGEFFGEFSLLLARSHRYEVRVVADSELMVVPKEQVDELLAANAELAHSIRRTLEDRLVANARTSALSL